MKHLKRVIIKRFALILMCAAMIAAGLRRGFNILDFIALGSAAIAVCLDLITEGDKQC